MACTCGVLLEADGAFSTGAAGLGGLESSVGVEDAGPPLSSEVECAGIGVSTSANGRGVSGGLASVEISDKASDGVSRPDDEVDFGKAE